MYSHFSEGEKMFTCVTSINDVSDSAKSANPTGGSFPAFYEEILGTFFDSAWRVGEAGYRNFLFMALPPLERTPGNLVDLAQGKPLYPNATQVLAYNHALKTGAQKFGMARRVHAMVFDTHDFFGHVLDDAKSYGIRNIIGYCPMYDAPDIATNYAAYGCLPISEYFWYSKADKHRL